MSLLLMIALAGCKSEAEKAQDYYESALEFVESGDIPRARLELRNALKEQPTHLGARTELARLNMSDRNFPAAYQNYLRVSEQDPNQLEAQVNLSRISFLLNDWEAFERHSAAALKLAADDPATRIVDIAARYRQSVMAEDGPGRNAVVADAEKAQADEPDSEILRQILIDGYLQDARYEEALEQIEKAIAFEPKRQQFYMLKLQTLARIGDEQGLEA
ncbi:tetratricopeptide repeat protein, partial [Primorskyibacter sedentarius]|uniref:tetratricopeptide repeat protein n=1 Tax=Primorskyibacter sedentarius TaxID=745311 RepID=UPI003EBA344D